jgi:uncharacterized Tic20 family protein
MAAKKAEVSDEERQQAMLVHFAGALFPSVAAYIGWVTYRDKSEFLAKQTKDALNWGITTLFLWACCGALAILSFGILGFLTGLAWVLNAGFCIIAGLRVRDKKDFSFPFSLDLIK